MTINTKDHLNSNNLYFTERYHKKLQKLAYPKFGHVLYIKNNGKLSDINIIRVLLEKIKELFHLNSRTNAILIQNETIKFLHSGKHWIRKSDKNAIELILKRTSLLNAVTHESHLKWVSDLLTDNEKENDHKKNEGQLESTFTSKFLPKNNCPRDTEEDSTDHIILLNTEKEDLESIRADLALENWDVMITEDLKTIRSENSEAIGHSTIQTTSIKTHVLAFGVFLLNLYLWHDAYQKNGILFPSQASQKTIDSSKLSVENYGQSIPPPSTSYYSSYSSYSNRKIVPISEFVAAETKTRPYAETSPYAEDEGNSSSVSLSFDSKTLLLPAAAIAALGIAIITSFYTIFSAPQVNAMTNSQSDFEEPSFEDKLQDLTEKQRKFFHEIREHVEIDQFERQIPAITEIIKKIESKSILLTRESWKYGPRSPEDWHFRSLIETGIEDAALSVLIEFEYYFQNNANLSHKAFISKKIIGCLSKIKDQNQRALILSELMGLKDLTSVNIGSHLEDAVEKIEKITNVATILAVHIWLKKNNQYKKDELLGFFTNFGNSWKSSFVYKLCEKIFNAHDPWNFLNLIKKISNNQDPEIGRDIFSLLLTEYIHGLNIDKFFEKIPDYANQFTDQLCKAFQILKNHKIEFNIDKEVIGTLIFRHLSLKLVDISWDWDHPDMEKLETIINNFNKSLNFIEDILKSCVDLNCTLLRYLSLHKEQDLLNDAFPLEKTGNAFILAWIILAFDLIPALESIKPTSAEPINDEWVRFFIRFGCAGAHEMGPWLNNKWRPYYLPLPVYMNKNTLFQAFILCRKLQNPFPLYQLIQHAPEPPSSFDDLLSAQLPSSFDDLLYSKRPEFEYKELPQTNIDVEDLFTFLNRFSNCSVEEMEKLNQSIQALELLVNDSTPFPKILEALKVAQRDLLNPTFISQIAKKLSKDSVDFASEDFASDYQKNREQIRANELEAKQNSKKLEEEQENAVRMRVKAQLEEMDQKKAPQQIDNWQLSQ